MAAPNATGPCRTKTNQCCCPLGCCAGWWDRGRCMVPLGAAAACLAAALGAPAGACGGGARPPGWRPGPSRWDCPGIGALSRRRRPWRPLIRPPATSRRGAPRSRPEDAAGTRARLWLTEDRHGWSAGHWDAGAHGIIGRPTEVGPGDLVRFRAAPREPVGLASLGLPDARRGACPGNRSGGGPAGRREAGSRGEGSPVRPRRIAWRLRRRCRRRSPRACPRSQRASRRGPGRASGRR